MSGSSDDAKRLSSFEEGDFFVAHVGDADTKNTSFEFKDEVALPTYEAPSIEKAKQFYIDNLPHRVPDQSNKSGFRLARPGEKYDSVTGAAAELYSVWGTEFKDLDEFGIGISLYFRELLFLFAIILICALVSLPTIKYYSDCEDGRTDNPSLEGSPYSENCRELKFSPQATTDIIVCVILLVFAVVSHFVEERAIEYIDVSQQTAQDYAVTINNPPRHMTDPDDYEKFFSKFGEVVFVTIAKNNGDLLQAIGLKRVMELQLIAYDAKESSGVNVVDQSDLLTWQICLQRLFGLFQTRNALEAKYEKHIDKIRGLTNLPYYPTKVYLLFNKECEQRRCLKDCSTGWAQQFTGVTSNENAKFGDKVIAVSEPVEPSEVIWEYLHVSRTKRTLRVMLGFFLSSILLVFAYLTLRDLSTGKNGLTAIIVSGINMSLPVLIKLITVKVEQHVDQSDLQESILTKLVAARCINTAVLIYLVTDYDDILSQGTLAQIQAILIADALTTPIYRLFNITDSIKRTFFAPKSKTQRQMNNYFRGAIWNLSERYTDIIKTVFVGMFYAAILPTGLFITAFSMLSSYWVDKYSLLRLWRRPPMYDESLATESRYYMVLNVWIHIYMSRIFFANWPWENEDDRASCGFMSCHIRRSMTDPQKRIVVAYNILSIVVTIFGLIFIFSTYTWEFVQKLFVDQHEEIGEATDIAYRDVSGITAYVPLVQPQQLTDPLICCDVGLIPRTYLPIRDLNDSAMEAVELKELCICSIDELPWIETQRDLDNLFSVVKFYPDKSGKMAGLMPVQTVTTPAVVVSPLKQGVQAIKQQVVNVAASINLAPEHLKNPALGSTRHLGDMGTLPDGWEEKRAANGRIYYVDHNTHITTWVKPQHSKRVVTHLASHDTATITPVMSSTPTQVLGQVQMAIQAASIPAGWEEKKTTDGRSYYVDHNTKKTQWEKPT